MTSPLEILYEDNHLLVVNKPAGIATMGAQSGPTIHSLAAEYLKRTYHKPGKAFVGVVSRLDTMTSGVLVLARTSKAASRLSQQFAAHGDDVQKIYLAAVDPPLAEQTGQWCDQVSKDDAARRMRVVGQDRPATKLARLRFQSVGQCGRASIVAVQLLTGRKHQIRVQFADRGHPVIGDRKYGSARPFPAGIALHGWRIRVLHPTRRQPMWFVAPRPPAWAPWEPAIPDDRLLWPALQSAFAISTSIES